MDKGMAVALISVAIGVALILVAIPHTGFEVVAGEEFTVSSARTTLGPFVLPSGTISLWFEDFREAEETHQWDTGLISAAEHSWMGTWPHEVEHRTLEGVPSEISHVFGRIPAGEYTLLLLNGDWTSINGTTIHIFFVRSTGALEGIVLSAGIALVVVGVAIFVVSRFQPCRGQRT